MISLDCLDIRIILDHDLLYYLNLLIFIYQIY